MRLCGDAQGGGIAFWAFLDRIRRGRAARRRGRLIEPGTPRMDVAALSATALFTLGTRGSALALAQANEARRLLAEAHGWEIERVALQVIRTRGDVIQDRPLAEAGGKGLFTKEMTPRSLSARLTRQSTRPRTCRRCRQPGSRSPLFSPARTCATRSLLPSPELSRACRTGRRLALHRSGVRPRCCACGALARQCRDTVAQGRGRGGRRDPARARRAEAARPRRSRLRRARPR